MVTEMKNKKLTSTSEIDLYLEEAVLSKLGNFPVHSDKILIDLK